MTATPRSRRRVLVAVSAVATASLGLGVAAGSRLTSPADAAARTAPPAASQITVPVERRALSSTVVARGDASFDGAVSLRIETGGLRTPAVVTGKVPAAGATVREGGVLLEITGRPVIGLAGVLPMYRTLSPGSRGPDVLQLEQTLRRLAYEPGEVDGTYDAATAGAVERLYAAAGYEPPEVDEQLTQAVDAASKQVTAAQDGVRAAERNLRQATAGPAKAPRVQADNAVARAKQALAAARKSGRGVADAQDQLELAQAQRADLLAGKDTSVERAAVTDAKKRLAEARTALGKARAKAGTPLPVSEVVFVKTLPRRVDDVKVARGGVVSGPVMSVSGAALVVTIKVDQATKDRLKVGMPATFDLGDGASVAATVTRITRAGTSYAVVVAPKKLTAAQLEQLRSANVKVTIPVRSTRGKVLAVPVAALSAGPDGGSRVEVLRDGKVELVKVTVGLSADGYAQVTPVGGALADGDQVVVGR